MQNLPLVSFIVISYKHEEYIADCLESILAQTYTNMEILYLDDASGDGTFQKACLYKKQFEEKYARVVFIENIRNRGLVNNLNELVWSCKGEYVKFLAADDFMLRDGIEKLVDLLEKHKEYDMVYSNGVTGNRDTHYPIREIHDNELIYRKEPPQGEDLFQQLYENDFIAAPGVMIKRATYEKIGQYDQNIGVEDWDYFLRIAREGSIGYLQAPAVMYRMLDTSLSHSSDPRRRMNMKKSELQILEKHKGNALNADTHMEISLNEAMRDAFHINNKEYLTYLYLYAKRNTLKISCRNRVKGILYNLGIIRFMNSKKH